MKKITNFVVKFTTLTHYVDHDTFAKTQNHLKAL